MKCWGHIVLVGEELVAQSSRGLKTNIINIRPTVGKKCNPESQQTRVIKKMCVWVTERDRERERERESVPVRQGESECERVSVI